MKFNISKLSPYIDGNGLMAPALCDPTTRGSDNGVMFSSEAIQIDPYTACIFLQPLHSCIVNGRLHRAPNDPASDAPDDYYGILSLRNYALTGAMWSHPTQFLIQPQVLCLAIEGTPYALLNPLRPLIALIIAVSGYLAKSPTANDSHADDWRLAWLLVKGMQGSLLCRLASKLWYKRLYKAFPKGMMEVASHYYRDSHPFTQVDWE